MNILGKWYQATTIVLVAVSIMFLAPAIEESNVSVLQSSAEIEHLAPMGVPASPKLSTFKQPSGHHFKARQFGDEKYNWMQTREGYTVKHNYETKYYEYMGVNSRGEFRTLGLKAGIDNIDGLGIQKKIRESKEIRRQKIDSFIQRYAKISPSSEKMNKAIIKTGTVKKLVIMANFSDTTPTYTQSQFDDFFNAHNYTNAGLNIHGSVWDYYNEASYGTFNLETTVSVWVTLPRPASFYGRDQYTYVQIPDRPDLGYIAPAQLMVVEAIEALEVEGFNFAPFDSDDADTYIDQFAVIHQGRGEEAGGGADTIWSHRWGIPTKQVDGVKISAYYTAPEKYYSSISTIGVYCHEFGHSLGLPDLYDTDSTSKGIGSWGIMASGSWNSSGSRPAHFTAWCKTQLGWITPTVISASSNGLTINRINDNAQAYKITYGMGTSEYYLIENRQKAGFDDGLPGSGIIVTHVDDTRTNNRDETRYWVGVVQADGLAELENNTGSADSGDPFPGSTSKTLVNFSTNPSIFSYSSGSDPGIEINTISSSASAMTFNVALGSGPPTQLKLTISPVEAVTDGAKWRLQGGSSWIDSEVTIDGLTGETVTVELLETPEWNPPANFQVTPTVGALTAIGATYTEKNSLSVTINPAAARTAGARWRRTTTSAWLASGDLERGIATGSHTIEFQNATNYNTPANISISIGDTEVVTRTVTYTEMGSITTTINPVEVRDAGARWRRTGTSAWFSSGATEEGLVAGSYTVEFNDVNNFNTPSNILVNLSESQDASETGTYTAKATLTVTINPTQAASAGAQWRRTGTSTWYNSGATEPGIDAGNYFVEFNDINDYNTPSNVEVTISESENETASATYTPKYSLKVTLSPAGAIAAGAKWRRVGTTPWLESGATESGLPDGPVSIEFRPAAGYATPANQSNSISGIYVVAATGAYPVIAFQVSASNEAGENGDQVTLSVSISDGTGVRAFGADFVFDTEYLEFVSAATRGSAVPGVFTFDSSLISGNTIRIGGISGDGETTLISGSGVIATFPLKIKDDVDLDIVSAINIIGLTDDFAVATTANGSVAISTTIINLDVNKDGTVTPGDALMVLQHYLGSQIITDAISLARANANGDGSITPGDALIVLNEYLGLND